MEKPFAFSLVAFFVSAGLFVSMVVFCVVLEVGTSKIRSDSDKQQEARDFIYRYQGQDVGEDPWGNKYKVEKRSEEGLLSVTIRSVGRDGEFGTHDDIVGGYRRSIEVEIKEKR